MIDKLRRYGWITAEFGVIVIALCVLLHVILGSAAGTAVSAIAANAIALFQQLPPGVSLGLAAIIVIERLLRARLAR